MTTDRYDAVHLLRQLPSKPLHNNHRQRVDPAEDRGWSDLESDSEDLFYMTDAEAADFAHSKARAALEAQRATRLARLPSPSPPTHSSTSTHANIEVDQRPSMSRTQFNLMQKTAKIISSSAHPAQLELKIFANHGGDARFAFLRRGEHQSIWEALKASKGELTYEAASTMLDDTKVDKARGAGLVAYDDSDSDSSPIFLPHTVDEAKEPTSNSQRAETSRTASSRQNLASIPILATL